MFRSVVRLCAALAVLFPFALAAQPAGEYAKHFAALSQLSVAVANAMPAEKYGFRPHPESMNFGQLMSHIASTNYQFCAGLKDTTPAALPSPSDKDAVVKFLSDSFVYCSGVIDHLTEQQLSATHRTAGFPDARCCWRCMCTWRIIAARPRSICAITASSRRAIVFELKEERWRCVCVGRQHCCRSMTCRHRFGSIAICWASSS